MLKRHFRFTWYSMTVVASRTRLRPPPVIRMPPTAATDPTSNGWAPRTLAPVSRLGKEKPLMEMLINGRTIMIRDAIFHNHATGKPVFFLYKLNSVVYNALLSAGKLPLMVDYIFNPRPTGGGAISSPPSRFLAISSKPMQLSPPNLQYPLSQHFYTLC